MAESDAANVLALRTAVDVSRDGIVIVDPGGDVCFANPAWLAMHGCQVLDHLPEAAFHTDAQLALDVRLLARELTRSGRAQRKVGHKALDGRVFDTWTTAAPLGSGGRVEIVRDLSAEAVPDAALLLERNVFLDSVVSRGADRKERLRPLPPRRGRLLHPSGSRRAPGRGRNRRSRGADPHRPWAPLASYQEDPHLRRPG